MRKSARWVRALLGSAFFCGGSLPFFSPAAAEPPAASASPAPAPAPASASAATPSVQLDRSAVAARGKQSALLTVGAFGRYALTASSSQGAALQLVDRMAGAGALAGEAGRQDGRLDLFLDRGEYKLVTRAAERGSGEVKLAAHAFRELAAPPRLLVEQRLERATLGDFEQRSYWLEIKERRAVAIEAAGRHLADLRLWRDGLWLVDAMPQVLAGQARPQQPLAVARLNLTLDPGLYLLSAYGGPSQPWTEASEQKPFLLRYGLPKLAPELRQQFTIGETGVERFVVPGSADFFRLELPVAEPASLRVESYRPDHVFGAGGNSARIDKRSLPPAAEVRFGGQHAKLVTVSGEPGKSFVLQYFEAAQQRTFGGSGSYWLSSIHAGAAEDSVGASAVLSRRPNRDARGKEELHDERAIDLDDSWRRRFNLLDELTLFIKVPSPTVIRVVGEGTGVKARYRLEPFLTSRPADYKTPPAHDSGHMFPVLAGLYVLTVIPETRGILDLQLLPGFSLRGGKPDPVAGAVRFADVRLDSNTDYTLYLNRQPGVTAGAVIRPLPIDLADALPVFQRAGETLQVPVSVPERGTLRARGEDGKLINLSLDNGKSGPAIEVEPGRYRVSVASAPVGRFYSLGLEAKRLSSTTPLPALPDARLAGLPKFPLLTPVAPDFIDLDRGRSASYNVRVDAPGLYQFETTGLLHTDGKVRTRVNPALFAEAKNGVGGNFQVQRYLREGDYQLTVTTLGETRGHLGVRVAGTGVVDGGELRLGEVARAELPAGRALAYRFKVNQRGSYHLQAMGLGRSFDVRLEDEAGWPVEAPIQRGDLNVELDPGSYRLMVMPQTHEARLLTRLDRNAEPKVYKGHGPHRMNLGAAVSHTWRETGKKRLRLPDLWDFALTAPAEVTLTLSPEMAGTLIDRARPKANLAPVASFDGRQAWRGTLPAGRYRVEVKTAGKNNLVDYTLQATSTQLLPGQSRSVVAPVQLPVSIGADGLVEIESFGPTDVRGRLYDGAGELVGQSDDRSGDWNFLLAQRLSPGEYRLQVDPVGSKRAATTVSVNVPGEVAEKVLPLGQPVEIRDARVHVYPLSPGEGNNVLVVSATSSDAVGLALEGRTHAGWATLGSRVDRDPYLALPLGEGFSAYRLRAWSADRRSLRLSLRVVAAKLPAQTETRWLQGGVTAQPVDPARPGLKLALVGLARPGVFRLSGELSSWRWSDSGRRSVEVLREAVIAADGKAVLLAGENRAGAEPPLPAAERLRLPSRESDALRLELAAEQSAIIDLQAAAGHASLLIASSRSGQPGVTLDLSGEANKGRDPSATGFVAGEAVSLVMPGMAAPARFWNAAGRSPIELDVRQVMLKPAERRALTAGLGEGRIPPQGLIALPLPGGELAVTLTLSPSNAAVFTRRGRIQSTHWAGGEALQETVRLSGADELLLVNAGGDEASYGVELAARNGGAPVALKPGELFERNVATHGRLSIPVELPAPVANGGNATTAPRYRLRVAGHQQAWWQERSGRVLAGEDFAPADSGSLWVQHRPGTVVAWLEDVGADELARFEAWRRTYGETRLTPPQNIALSGRQKLLGWRAEQPAMLQLRSESPLVAQFLLTGQPARTEVQLHGAVLNLPMTGGEAQLLLRPIGAEQLSGALTINTTPALKLVDGPGPEVLLGSGAARLFWFELSRPATIGIGVRASADVIRATLYDAAGSPKAEGVVQMPTLAPGRYYLVVEMPPDSPPVKVRPMMLGLAVPDTRPPYEILRRYVEHVEGEAGPLIYEPPPPPPPPSTVLVEGEDETNGERAAENGEGGEAEPPNEERSEEEGGEMPAEEGL